MNFFTDPILRAPTWGCMLMCLATSLMGVLIFLRKRSLLGETLSHAAYPGAVVGILLFKGGSLFSVLGGAFVSSWCGYKAVEWLERRIRPDAALTFVLAVFFGIGIVIASAAQAHKDVQMLLFGQVATMGDLHIGIYGALALFVIGFLGLKFRALQAELFDPDFAKSAGIRASFLWLFLIALIMGIRSVGVVLMSGMVIAPAVAARQFTNRLHTMLILAGSFGVLSGFLGNYLSVIWNLPTGPMIVLVATAIALGSLIWGWAFRMGRIYAFRVRCAQENILKSVWKKGKLDPNISRFHHWRLRKQGWITAKGELTFDGKIKAANIVRLHRLWELYLTEELKFCVEKVHKTAEEMEHILTPEMEVRLTRLLDNPKQDPHKQPIPEKP
jgi:manganese/zinc/iron transport system permease protein